MAAVPTGRPVPPAWSGDDHLRAYVRHSSDRSNVPNVRILIGLPRDQQLAALRQLRGYTRSSGLDALIRQLEST